MKWFTARESLGTSEKTGESGIKQDVYTSNNPLGLQNDSNGKFNDQGHGHHVTFFPTQTSETNLLPSNNPPRDVYERPNGSTRQKPNHDTKEKIKKRGFW
ncbi:MAG TPA: hypothetical protein VFS21_40100 [Roseiflexaceae bacterium]|nr:hypothetical protein [Roseiflexaceae bacterium]